MTFLVKQLDPWGPIASRGGPYHILRKPMAICDFPGGGGTCTDPAIPPPSGSAHVIDAVFGLKSLAKLLTISGLILMVQMGLNMSVIRRLRSTHRSQIRLIRPGCPHEESNPRCAHTHLVGFAMPWLKCMGRIQGGGTCGPDTPPP